MLHNKTENYNDKMRSSLQSSFNIRHVFNTMLWQHRHEAFMETETKQIIDIIPIRTEKWKLTGK